MVRSSSGGERWFKKASENPLAILNARALPACSWFPPGLVTSAAVDDLSRGESFDTAASSGAIGCELHLSLGGRGDLRG